MSLDLDEAKLADFAELLRERQREREVLNEEARRWRASEERYNAKQQEVNRKAWAEYHLTQAESLERTAIQLAANHRARAEKLLGEENA